jgi:hypothetical protein
MLTVNGIQLQFGRLRSARYRSPTSVSCAINVLSTSATQVTLDATCRTGPGSRAVRKRGVCLVRLCANESFISNSKIHFIRLPFHAQFRCLDLFHGLAKAVE